jgi:hypothetical protein
VFAGLSFSNVQMWGLVAKMGVSRARLSRQGDLGFGSQAEGIRFPNARVCSGGYGNLLRPHSGVVPRGRDLFILGLLMREGESSCPDLRVRYFGFESLVLGVCVERVQAWGSSPPAVIVWDTHYAQRVPLFSVQL